MNTIYHISLKASLLALALLAMSCNSFLDELPSKSSNMPITTTEQLDALLAKYTDFCNEPNKAAFVGHDDYEYSTVLYDSLPTWFGGPTLSVLQSYLWDYTDVANAVSDGFWSGEYRKIFRANMVLEALDGVSGSDADKTRLRAEAYFIRAYSHWVLVNTYALPYTEQHKAEPGIPLKKSTSYEETAARATIEATYQFIESDLQEALKCTTPLNQSGTLRHWRANTAGIHAFAARFYLNRNNYSQALIYANKALAEYNVLVDYNTEVNFIYPLGSNIAFPSMFVSTYDDYTQRIAWKETLYMRGMLAGYVDQLYFPSSDLLALYDTVHDLRYRYHMVGGYLSLFGTTYNYPTYMFFTTAHIPSGPTTAEMYLIRAECEARTGAFAQAMTTLNNFRAKRIEPGAWVSLVAANKDEAIRHILDERRREMPFAQRWYDVRRCNNNDDPNDDVSTITRTFYRISSSTIYNNEAPITYTLDPNSRKYAYPINNTELATSNGVMQQNMY